MSDDIKRLFFGLEVVAPWPEQFPAGRIIQDRHITLAFLGNFSLEKALQLALDAPKIQFSPVGIFSECVFLPKKRPRVCAWHINWLSSFTPFQSAFTDYLIEKSALEPSEKTFLSHVTLCRAPFNKTEWKNAFTALPVYASKIHLYESVGSLQYVPRYSYPLAAPFIEIEHTADIAFEIQASTIQDLFIHAQIALTFTFPELIPYFFTKYDPKNIEEIISQLNLMIAEADSEIGSPVKAVSFHGEICEKNSVLSWQMIVDV